MQVIKDKRQGWEIHYVSTGILNMDTYEIKKFFIGKTCNYHTHGMNRFGHPDFQIVLRVSPDDVSHIFKSLVSRVRFGMKLKAGDLVHDIYKGMPLRLEEFREAGRNVLRVVVPDPDNRFPEDENCDPDYKMQLLPTKSLYRSVKELENDESIEKLDKNAIGRTVLTAKDLTEMFVKGDE